MSWRGELRCLFRRCWRQRGACDWRRELGAPHNAHLLFYASVDGAVLCSSDCSILCWDETRRSGAKSSAKSVFTKVNLLLLKVETEVLCNWIQQAGVHVYSDSTVLRIHRKSTVTGIPCENFYFRINHLTKTISICPKNDKRFETQISLLHNLQYQLYIVRFSLQIQILELL